MTKGTYQAYGLPSNYLGMTYETTALPKVKQEEIRSKIEHAPRSGTLYVKGTAAPIVNQLLSNRSVRGLSFYDLCGTAFEQHQYPRAGVVVVLGVGDEISINTKVSSLVLNSILKSYAKRQTLLIIETGLTKTQLLEKYSVDAVNFIQIPQIKEKQWI